MISLVNGTETDTLSISDRGLNYGDGLFETILAVNGDVPLWRYHMERLVASCQRLGLSCPDPEQIYQRIQPYLDSSGQQIIKLIITRGISERGYAYQEISGSTEIIQIDERRFLNPDFWCKGVRVCRCQTTLSKQPRLAGIKHLNRLEQVLARNEWRQSTIQEGLMCTEDGDVIEATSHNVFAVKQAKLYTPDLSACGVDGIMRRYVIELAGKIGISVYSKAIPYQALKDMDELFLTNSITGIWPIRALEDTDYRVGTMTCRFQERINQLLPYQ